MKRIREPALCSLARLTRRFHPRGTERVLRLLHNPDRRPWAVETVAPLRGRGLRLLVRTDSFLEWQVFFFGAYEPEVADVLERCIRPGRSAIDVGANVGIHTLVMSRVVGDGTVLACEPVPDLCARLRANVSLNAATNVRIREVAVSDREQRVTLYLPDTRDTNQGRASLLPDPAVAGGAPRVRAVACTTLDALAAAEDIRDVDLIKIDVNGLDARVLAGADGLLARYHPTLVFEYDQPAWLQAGHGLESVLGGLRARGYGDFFAITRSGLRPLAGGSCSFANVLAVADGAVLARLLARRTKVL